jgi:hypothetical protein
MNNLILFLFFTASILSANAQLEVKESAKDSVIWKASKSKSVPKLVRFTMENLENYTLYYKNEKHTDKIDVDYISLGDKETAIKFFTLCSNAVDNESINVSIDGAPFTISKSKDIVLIWSSISHFYLTKKQLNSIQKSLGLLKKK